MLTLASADPLQSQRPTRRSMPDGDAMDACFSDLSLAVLDVAMYTMACLCSDELSCSAGAARQAKTTRQTNFFFFFFCQTNLGLGRERDRAREGKLAARNQRHEPCRAHPHASPTSEEALRTY